MRRPHDLVLGQIAGTSRTLAFPRDLRDKHTYVCGATGVGKSKFLEHVIQQDLIACRKSGCSVMVIDPHGSLYDNLMTWMARTGLSWPVIPIDLRQDDWIISYNLLRARTANTAVLVKTLIEAISHVWNQNGVHETPLFARWCGSIFHALFEKRLTLADALHVLTTHAELRHAITRDLRDPIARRDFELADQFRPRELEEQFSSTMNRLEPFLRNETIRSIFGNPDASLDFSTALEDGSIILVSLAQERARISSQEADLVATLLLSDLWTAAQERGKRKSVAPLYLYLDEFQKMVTPTITANLDQARGFGMCLTLANQYPRQLLNAGSHGQALYDSIMENASSKVVFRLSHEDNLKPLAQWLFRGVMDPDEVKLKLYSTKVMGYREEYRTAYSHSTTNSEGGTTHSGASASESQTHYGDGETASSWNEAIAEMQSKTASWSDAKTDGETDSLMLIPQMGQELSHVQFRSLEEQLFRAMAALFDQEQRQSVTRLVGMKAPISLFTPHVSESRVRPERVKEFAQECYERLPFAMRGSEARRRLAERDKSLPIEILQEARGAIERSEPQTARRRVKRV